MFVLAWILFISSLVGFGISSLGLFFFEPKTIGFIGSLTTALCFFVNAGMLIRLKFFKVWS